MKGANDTRGADRKDKILRNAPVVFGLVLSGVGAVLGGLGIISTEQTLGILLGTAAVIAVNQLIEQNLSSEARKQVDKIPKIENSLSDALNAIRRIELNQLAANAVLVKVPDKEAKGYIELWGGFDPSGFYAYNPAYAIESKLAIVDPNKQVVKQFAERYKNNFPSCYLFFTKGDNGQKDYDSFCQIMKDARETIPSQEERKNWDDNVAQSLRICLRTDIESTALGHNEFYLGEKGGKKVCIIESIIEPNEGVICGSSTKRGQPHYYIVTTDDAVWDLCLKRFLAYYNQKLEVTEIDKKLKS